MCEICCGLWELKLFCMHLQENKSLLVYLCLSVINLSFSGNSVQKKKKKSQDQFHSLQLEKKMHSLQFKQELQRSIGERFNMRKTKGTEWKVWRSTYISSCILNVLTCFSHVNRKWNSVGFVPVSYILKGQFCQTGSYNALNMSQLVESQFIWYQF